ncbi:hypothetical protein [Nonomuraea dietziae]|uniref:hypothetical protein n=1 Tax=Nonomuraea dietziae TaxID=65515 RepID=UPI00341CC54B
MTPYDLVRDHSIAGLAAGWAKIADVADLPEQSEEQLLQGLAWLSALAMTAQAFRAVTMTAAVERGVPVAAIVEAYGATLAEVRLTWKTLARRKVEQGDMTHREFKETLRRLHLGATR